MRRCAIIDSASGRPMPPARVRSKAAQALAAASPSRTAARSRGSPRCRASREMARAISGAVRSRRRTSSRKVSFSRRNPTASSRAAIAWGSRRGPDSRAASSRAPGPVTVRSMAASRLPCRSPLSERSSSRLARLGASMTRRLAGPALRGGLRHGRRPICVSSTYLRRAPMAASSAREKSPKACEIGDAQLRFEQPLAGEAIERSAGHRRRRRAGDADPLPHLLVGEQPVGGDHLARGQAHDLAGKVRGRHLAHLELPGRDVERGERDHIGLATARLGAVEHCGQIVARLGVEQAVLGQRAGRDQAHHVAAHDCLRAALPRLGRVLELLAHGDAEALADQPLQVFVGAMDRHAAHGDVVAQVLAALGQHDAQRLRRGHGVLEEQLVEVSHAVEKQAVRIGRLDLQELRHGGRDARRRHCRPCGAGALFRGSGGGRRRRLGRGTPAPFALLCVLRHRAAPGHLPEGRHSLSNRLGKPPMPGCRANPDRLTGRPYPVP